MALPEGTNMLIENSAQPQDIKLTSTVKVSAGDDKRATIAVPAELRLTPALMALLNQALQAQGLVLAHMNITDKHVEELKDLPNVVLGESQKNS